MGNTVTVKMLHWRAANTAVAAAMEKADQLGIAVTAVVMDRGGNTVASLRNVNAPFHTQRIAADKATTAAGFGMPTSQWWSFVESMNSPAITAGLPATDRLVVFGGGVPIYESGELIGGIGVSGGSEAQDEECARAGLQAAGLAADAG